MATLERAIEIASRAHAGQRDKAGAPYILHPLRVMLRVETDTERIAAVLHDVVEDSTWTLEQLRSEGFAPEVLEAVEALTRRPEESYEQFVLRAGAHPIARRVKIADLTDNLDPSRIAAPTEHDRARMDRYRRAIAVLTGSVP
jgi:guanosine-3',5'-bis(diphosphate) 3'-pyrophosphohydrolase